MHILDHDISLEHSFLFYDFLNKIIAEVKIVMEEENSMDIPEFDEIVSLRQVVLINIYNQNLINVKYFFHESYQSDDLVDLINAISKTLFLVNLVDEGLGKRVWFDALENSLYSYFFYFVLIFEESYEKKYDKPDGTNDRLDIFKTESERLLNFFSHFVKTNEFERVSKRAELMIKYLGSRNEAGLKQIIVALIDARIVRSRHFLVFSI